MDLWRWFRRITTLNNHHGLAAQKLAIGTGANVNTGVQVVQQCVSPELIVELKKLGIAETAINSFFLTLLGATIPAEEWDTKLREFAKSYIALQEIVKNLPTNSVQGAELKAQAEAAIDNGEFDKAQHLFDEIRVLNLQVAEQNMVFAAEADAANGALAHTRIRYIESGEYYQQAARTLLVLGSEYEVKAAEYLVRAGNGFKYGGDYRQAQQFYEQALEINKRRLDKYHSSMALVLHNLANTCELMGQYKKTLELYKQVLEIDEHLVDKNHINIAITLNNMGWVYYLLENYDSAKPLYERAISIFEIWRGYPEMGAPLNNLALLYQKTGNDAMAESLYERALEIRTKWLGNDHPDTLTTQHNLAGLYAASKEHYTKAQLLYESVLASREQILGKNHPDVATTLNNLGSLYFDMSKYSDAVVCLKRALKIRELKLGQEHSYTKITRQNLDRVLEKIQ